MADQAKLSALMTLLGEIEQDMKAEWHEHGGFKTGQQKFTQSVCALREQTRVYQREMRKVAAN